MLVKRGNMAANCLVHDFDVRRRSAAAQRHCRSPRVRSSPRIEPRDFRQGSEIERPALARGETAVDIDYDQANHQASTGTWRAPKSALTMRWESTKVAAFNRLTIGGGQMYTRFLPWLFAGV